MTLARLLASPFSRFRAAPSQLPPSPTARTTTRRLHRPIAPEHPPWVSPTSSPTPGRRSPTRRPTPKPQSRAAPAQRHPRPAPTRSRAPRPRSTSRTRRRAGLTSRATSPAAAATTTSPRTRTRTRTSPTQRRSSRRVSLPRTRAPCDRADSLAECTESKECHAPKHHYDECVERVTGQIEKDGQASEDCVEECTPSPVSACAAPSNTRQSSTSPTAPPNAPPPSSSPSSSRRARHPPAPTTPASQWQLATLQSRRVDNDTSWMTVDMRLMFRISLYYFLLPRHVTLRALVMNRNPHRLQNRAPPRVIAHARPMAPPARLPRLRAHRASIALLHALTQAS